MADAKITELTELAATPDNADVFVVVDDPTGIPTTKKITYVNSGIPSNTVHRTSAGIDHSDVVLNNTHRASNGTDHANVVLNDTHRVSDGKDHSDVVLNNTHRSSDGKNHSDVVLNNTHRVSDGTDHANVVLNTAMAPRLYMANDLSFSNNADWAVNGIAQLLPDSNDNNYSSLRFSNSTAEGTGFETYIPATATNIIIETMSRSETGGSGTAALDLYFQTIADNTTPSAWSAGLSMTDITLGADENWQKNSQTIALSTLGATADRFTQFELVRDGGTMANDWTLLYIRVSYS